MAKKTSNEIFSKFMQLLDKPLAGETIVQAANRWKLKQIMLACREGHLNDIICALDTPNCNCAFCIN
jgi:hypothetical protein